MALLFFYFNEARGDRPVKQFTKKYSRNGGKDAELIYAVRAQGSQMCACMDSTTPTISLLNHTPTSDNMQ